MKDALKEWLNGLEADVYFEGIQKHVTGYDKCLIVCDDYVGRLLGFCNKEIYFFIFILCSFLYSPTDLPFWMVMALCFTVH